MKKQLMIFVFIFLLLSLGVHSDKWFSMPLEHISQLPSSTGYGMGAFHPIGFTILAFALFSFFAFIFKKVKNIFIKSN
ncbi:MAG: hypothetical protein FNT15_06755 [Sulfurovum sp.]|nr:MAG: hypothetical protein FNT15_06755 [Sulfurovum sp.]